jgi:hypothetical protein
MSVSPDQFERRFAPYDCRKLAGWDAGFETWTTGWGMDFTLPVLPDGHYD